jgi:hypothetical protein
MADVTALIMDDHEWFRRQFASLDDARTAEELAAVWQPLAQRLETHAQAEETIFYPALLRSGEPDGPATDETTDAISDHNKIRDAIAEAGRHEVGSPPWFEAVGRARSENSEHLAEEEDEGLPDFRKHASFELRQRLGQLWQQFYAAHADARSISTADVDPQEYLDQHT